MAETPHQSASKKSGDKKSGAAATKSTTTSNGSTATASTGPRRSSVYPVYVPREYLGRVYELLGHLMNQRQKAAEPQPATSVNEKNRP